MTIEMIDFPSIFTKEQIQFIGERVAESAQEVCGEKLRDVILFGSYARGDFEEWSDVDIMVLADADDMGCKAINADIDDKLSELTYHMNLLLSTIVTPYSRFMRMKDAYPFYRNVHTEGVRLC